MNDIDIKTWRAQRNAALSTLDMEYARQWMPVASCDEVRLIAMHKARYICLDLAAELRHASAAWLRERGYGDAMGAPLLPEGELTA